MVEEIMGEGVRHRIERAFMSGSGVKRSLGDPKRSCRIYSPSLLELGGREENTVRLEYAFQICAHLGMSTLWIMK